MACRQTLVAYNRQVNQWPAEFQRRECGLIEIGRAHARNFDAGHAPSGGGVQRVLMELRKLAAKMESGSVPPKVVVSELDAIRARCASRLTDAQD